MGCRQPNLNLPRKTAPLIAQTGWALSPHRTYLYRAPRVQCTLTGGEAARVRNTKWAEAGRTGEAEQMDSPDSCARSRSSSHPLMRSLTYKPCGQLAVVWFTALYTHTRCKGSLLFVQRCQLLCQTCHTKPAPTVNCGCEPVAANVQHVEIDQEIVCDVKVSLPPSALGTHNGWISV